MGRAARLSGDGYDLVIVGGGNAGMAAAATAGELALRTLVVEKTDRLGGQLHWSSGHFSGAGTKRQTERGIVDHPDDHFADVMRIGHGRANPDLVRLAVDAAPDAIDWLARLGFPFAAAAPSFVSGHELYSAPRTYWGGEDPRTGGRPIYETLLPGVAAADITVALHSRVVAVRPRAAGVDLDVATGDTHRRIHAGSVVLATGGYAAARDLIADLQPEYATALTGCLDHATGDGHRLLLDLDVPLTHTDTYVPTMGMIEDPERPGFGIPLHRARVIVNAVERPPWEIWVNRRGHRFVAEDTRSPFERERALMAQPDLEMFVIWDQAAMESAAPVIGPDWTRAGVETEADRDRWLHRRSSWHELAATVGIDLSGLAATLDEYRRTPDVRGREYRPVPLDRPPFYAVRCVGGMLLSRGGPTVDEWLRPVQHDGTPLRNIYAVGELLGMGQLSGDSFAGGMSVGPALALGRRVVQWIAAGLVTA